jgi:hypothetical protein
VDGRVADSIKNFKSSLTRVGSSVKGVLSVRFFITLKKSSWFTQVEEKQCFERWVLPVVVRTEKSIAADSLESDSRTHIDHSRDQVQRCLIDIFEVEVIIIT